MKPSFREWLKERGFQEGVRFYRYYPGDGYNIDDTPWKRWKELGALHEVAVVYREKLIQCAKSSFSRPLASCFARGETQSKALKLLQKMLGWPEVKRQLLEQYAYEEGFQCAWPSSLRPGSLLFRRRSQSKRADGQCLCAVPRAASVCLCASTAAGSAQRPTNSAPPSAGGERAMRLLEQTTPSAAERCMRDSHAPLYVAYVGDHPEVVLMCAAVNQSLPTMEMGLDWFLTVMFAATQ